MLYHITDLDRFLLKKTIAAGLFNTVKPEDIDKIIPISEDQVVITFKELPEVLTVEKSQFLREFFRQRKERSLGLHVNRFYAAPNTVFVWNPVSKGNYAITQNRDNSLHCSCTDYQNQAQVGFEKPCCKHIYAYLNQLGISSLEDWEKSSEDLQVPYTPAYERWVEEEDYRHLAYSEF